MLSFLCNPFNDPNDPWYYVIGVIFLLLIFGALALYVFLANKKKDGQDETETTEQSTEPENAEAVADVEQQDQAEQAEESDPPQDSSEIEETKQEEEIKE